MREIRPECLSGEYGAAGEIPATTSDCCWQALQRVTTVCCQLRSSQCILSFESGTWQQTRIFRGVRPDAMPSKLPRGHKTLNNAHPASVDPQPRTPSPATAINGPQTPMHNIPCASPRLPSRAARIRSSRRTRRYAGQRTILHGSGQKAPPHVSEPSPPADTAHSSAHRFELSGDLRLSDIRRRAVSTSNTVTFTI